MHASGFEFREKASWQWFGNFGAFGNSKGVSCEVLGVGVGLGSHCSGSCLGFFSVSSFKGTIKGKLLIMAKFSQ